MKKTMSIATLFFMLLLAACNKKDTAASKTVLLTSGTWKLTAVVSDNDANGTYETDDFATFSPCFTDNILSFSASSIVTQDEGPTKCNPADPQTETTTWQFTQNESYLKIWNDEWKLEELTTSTLKWKEEYAGGNSALVTFTKR